MPRAATGIEKAAIALHDHIWLNIGPPISEWPLHLGGDAQEVTEFIHLLNTLQREIRRDGKQTFEYDNFDIPI